MTSATTNLEFPTKQGLTARRHKIDILLKKAAKGNLKAKEKLLDEYGIKVYSSSEVEEYKKSKLDRRIRKLSLRRGNNDSRNQTVRNK